MKKLLVINNDFDTMSLLKSWLEKKLYKVKFTGNHHEAINLLKVFGPSLIIIDILQYNLLLAIKSYKEFKDVPMLLMTGYTSKPAKKNLPVNDIIEKPFNLPLFEKKI
jgi:CheY-like chemotaxis protein